MMKRSFTAGFLLLPAFILSVSFLRAEESEKPLKDCDTIQGWMAKNGAIRELVDDGNGGKAIHQTLPAVKLGGKLPLAGFYVQKDRRGDYFKGTDGIRFRVKGKNGTRWATISLLYDEDKYLRYYAQFPVKDGEWTEVTLPWREFYQRNFRGPVEEHLGEIFAVWFIPPSNRDAGHPLNDVPAQDYVIDDIRLVSGLSKAETPLPKGSSIAKTVKKMKSKKPVKIVVVGASITWGLKCSNPAQDAMPNQLQTLLRKHFGYDEITVLNRSVGGFSTYQIGTTLGRWVYDESPVDLLIFSGDPNYNDATDARKFEHGIDQSVDNFRRLFTNALLRGDMEIMYVFNALHVDQKNMGINDELMKRMKRLVDSMHIVSADVYHDFQKHGADWLFKHYYTAGGDPVHYAAAGQKRAAEVVLEAILASEK